MSALRSPARDYAMFRVVIAKEAINSWSDGNPQIVTPARAEAGNAAALFVYVINKHYHI